MFCTKEEHTQSRRNENQSDVDEKQKLAECKGHKETEGTVVRRPFGLSTKKCCKAGWPPCEGLCAPAVPFWRGRGSLSSAGVFLRCFLSDIHNAQFGLVPLFVCSVLWRGGGITQCLWHHFLFKLQGKRSFKCFATQASSKGGKETEMRGVTRC